MQIEDVRVQDVADALEIHPSMLSKWRRDAREGRIRARVVLKEEQSRHRPAAGLIFRSDRGTEYSAYAYRARLAAHDIVQSMNRFHASLQRYTTALRAQLSRSN